MAKVRLLFVIPASMGARPGGSKEMRRRTRWLRALAADRAVIDVADVPDAPAYLNSADAVTRSAAGVIRRLIDAERDGYDAGIIGCMVNPGLAAARQAVTIPVVGGAEAAFLAAARAGTRFSVLTPLVDAQRSAMVRQLVRAARCGEQLASVRSVAAEAAGTVADRALAAGRRAIAEDGAAALVLGVMAWSFGPLPGRLTAQLGTPVIDAVQTAVAAALR